MKNFVVQVTKGEEVRFLDPEQTGRFLNTETYEVVLSVGLSPAPVAMEKERADFWALQILGLDGAGVEVKPLQDVDPGNLDTH